MSGADSGMSDSTHSIVHYDDPDQPLGLKQLCFSILRTRPGLVGGCMDRNRCVRVGLRSKSKGERVQWALVLASLGSHWQVVEGAASNERTRQTPCLLLELLLEQQGRRTHRHCRLHSLVCGANGRPPHPSNQTNRTEPNASTRDAALR